MQRIKLADGKEFDVTYINGQSDGLRQVIVIGFPKSTPYEAVNAAFGGKDASALSVIEIYGEEGDFQGTQRGFTALMEIAVRPQDGISAKLRQDDDVGAAIEALRKEADGLRAELEAARKEAKVAATAVNKVKGDVDAVKGDVNKVKGDVDAVKDDVNAVKGEVGTLLAQLDDSAGAPQQS